MLEVGERPCINDTTSDSVDSVLRDGFKFSSKEIRALIAQGHDWAAAHDDYVRLSSKDTSLAKVHLLSLSKEDLHLRFGYNISEPRVNMYIDRLNFHRDVVLGVLREGRLVAFCHLAVFPEDGREAGELGISILAEVRGQGIATKLMGHCFTEAAKNDLSKLQINYLSHNTAMAMLCRKFGAKTSSECGDVTAVIEVYAEVNRYRGRYDRRSTPREKMSYTEALPLALRPMMRARGVR